MSDGLAVFGDHFGHLRSELDFVEALFPDDVWLGVVEPVEVAFLQVLLKLIGRVVKEVEFLHRAVVILVHGVTVDLCKQQVFVNLELKLSQILAFDDFDGAQIRIVRDLLVAEPILNDGVSIFKLFGRLLLNDVAAHVKHLLLGARNGHNVFNRLFTTIEK